MRGDWLGRGLYRRSIVSPGACEFLVTLPCKQSSRQTIRAFKITALYLDGNNLAVGCMQNWHRVSTPCSEVTSKCARGSTIRHTRRGRTPWFPGDIAANVIIGDDDAPSRVDPRDLQIHRSIFA